MTMTMMPRPGTGTRLTIAGSDFIYSAKPASASFAHPFRPALGGGGVRLARGLVEFREPTIKGVKIGGEQGKAQPVLKLDAATANAKGESWVCVELHPDDHGAIPADSEIEIVHSRQTGSVEKDRALCPLVMILWRNRRPVQAFAIVHFNLRYARVLPPGGAIGAVRHVFY